MGWVQRVFRRGGLYADLAEEMRGHLEEKTEQYVREGLSREDAERAARRAFGNVTLLAERGREVWQWRRLENLWRDVGFSARLLKKSPGFTAVAILTLMLGIGANTAIFSLLNGLLLRPLPVPHADQLVSFRLPGANMNSTFCPALVRALEPRHDVFTDIFSYAQTRLKIQGNHTSEPVAGVYVSGQYFSAFDVAPELGRALTSADDTKDSKATAYPAVISDGLWASRFNRDPGIIGKRLVLNKVPFTVVGVMPKSFVGFDPTSRPQVWMPLMTEARVDAPFDNIDGGYYIWWLSMGGRLRPGVSLAKANAWLRSVSPSIFTSAIPDPKWSMGKTHRSDMLLAADPASNGYSYLRGTYGRPLVLIFVFCCALLLLACINLASLLLARTALRQREIATRLAIGATRRRIVQQLFVDSVLVALLGTGAGIAVAPLASHALISLLKGGRGPVYLDAGIDWRVCLFVAGLAAVSAVLVGLVPAWQATAGDLNRQLKDGRHSTRPEHRRLLPKVLLAVEVALALLIVSAAGLLSTSLYRLYHDGLGFNPKNLLVVDLDFNANPMKGIDLQHLYADLSDRLATVPGVRSVAYAEAPPLSGATYTDEMRAPGGADQDIRMNAISTGYLASLQIPLLAGRMFDKEDAAVKTSNLILVNQRAARLFFPKGNGVGKILNNAHSKGPGEQIIGVVGDTKYDDIHQPGPPTVYHLIPDIGKPSDGGIQSGDPLLIRISVPPAAVIPSIRRIITKYVPWIPAPTFTTMEQQITEAVVSERIMALLSVFFAITALLVTGIGLYGVLAWSTARRTSEIGIRMALGAQRGQVVRLIFRENLWTAVAGCLIGLAAALLASHAIASFLYGTSPQSPLVLTAALLLLCLVAAAASLVPALRAASIDPMQALRSE
jgi:predicted permease